MTEKNHEKKQEQPNEKNVHVIDSTDHIIFTEDKMTEKEAIEKLHEKWVRIGRII